MKNLTLIAGLFLCFNISLIHSISAQNSTKMETRYEVYAVSFGSECCGIDSKAFDELQAYSKKFQRGKKEKLSYETIRWGKEGERILYFNLTQLTDNQSVEFADKLSKMFPHKEYKLVKAQPILYFQSKENTLWVHCIPFGINQKREKKWLEYVAEFESNNQVKMLQGWMINETHNEADQDKRYELRLGQLTEKQRNEFISQTKAIFIAAEE